MPRGTSKNASVGVLTWTSSKQAGWKNEKNGRALLHIVTALLVRSVGPPPSLEGVAASNNRMVIAVDMLSHMLVVPLNVSTCADKQKLYTRPGSRVAAGLCVGRGEAGMGRQRARWGTEGPTGLQ